MTATAKSLTGNCDSCLMPFKKDPQGVAREHEKYCSYCYSGGKLCYEGNDVKEFKQAMIAAIESRGESKIKARFFAFMAGFAPRWKK
ncbi:MAG: zinc ribbon domain-containing protein [Mycobacteriaceae bacterium]